MDNEQNVIDYIQNYLQNEYMDDLHFVFQLDFEREGGRRPWLQGYNANDANMKSNIRAMIDQTRHFVFSSVFLYQLMVHNAIWDDMSHDDYNYSDEAPYNETMDYEDFETFHENSGWPDFGLDIWKEFSPKYSQKKLDGLQELMNRYGLMITFLNDSLHRFLLACIFNVLQRILQDELFDLDIPSEVGDRIAEHVNEYAKRIMATLSK